MSKLPNTVGARPSPMPYDPVQTAFDWFETFLGESDKLPDEHSFGLLAASAADERVRDRASEIEWLLFTATFYEVALVLYQDGRAAQSSQLSCFKRAVDV